MSSLCGSDILSAFWGSSVLFQKIWNKSLDLTLILSLIQGVTDYGYTHFLYYSSFLAHR